MRRNAIVGGTEIPFPWGPGDDKRVPDDFKDKKKG